MDMQAIACAHRDMDMSARSEVSMGRMLRLMLESGEGCLAACSVAAITSALKVMDETTQKERRLHKRKSIRAEFYARYDKRE